MKTMQAMQSLRAARKQKGFTIIELVVVILLLGILAATALPRFMDVTDQAHEAVVEAVEGGLATGAALLRAQWFAEGQPGTVAGFGDGAVTVNNGGYPALAAQTSQACIDIYTELLQSGRPTADDVDQGGLTIDPDHVVVVDPLVDTPIEYTYDGHAASDVAGAAANVEFIAVLDLAAEQGSFYCEDDDDDGACDVVDTFFSDAGLTTATDVQPGTTCSYYYVGQFKALGAVGSGTTIPVLSFDLSNGEVTRSDYPFASI